MTRRKSNDDAPHQRMAAAAESTVCVWFEHRPWLLVLVLVVVTFAAYQPTWHAGFIWDDDDHLTANPAMTAPHGLRMIWSSLAVSRYYPLTLTSFWVQRRLGGLNPLPYHLVNVALHAANGVLVFVLLRRLRVRSAWLAAMLWGLHPVNVDSVAWITELKNTQSGLFFLLALLVFLRFEDELRPRDYVFSLVCGAGAMLSKPSTVVLPGVMMLCAWWRRGRWTSNDLLRVAPLVAVGIGMSLLTVVEQRQWVERLVATGWRLTMGQRLMLAGRAVWFYAGKLLWPMDLCFIYPRWELAEDSAVAWLPLVGLLLVCGLLWRFRRAGWTRPVILGLGYFAIALLPVLGFFDVFFFRYSFVADHFQYLASIGLIGLVVGTGTIICHRAGQVGRSLGTFGATVLLLVLGLSCWKRAHVYRNPETLWQDTVTRNPSAYMAHNNLGNFFLQAGKPQEAIGEYEQALRLKPDDAEAYINLGNVLLQRGQVQEAIGRYQQSIRINPNFAVAHRSLGLALERTGKVPEAAWQYEEALRLRPNDAEAHNRLGFVLKTMGKMSQAAWQYEEALRIKPDYPEVLNNLAWLLATRTLAEGGDAVRAVGLAQAACKLSDGRSANYLDTLAAAYAAAGHFDDAVSTAQKAIELADSTGQTQLVSRIEMRLELYRVNHVYHEKQNLTGSDAR